jgi:CRISPR/Cas system-associated endoribonuclease Cas2
MVIKKSEVRIYDIQKGQFQQLQNSIFEGDKKSEITRYKIDKRNRKAYITNDQGLI